MKTLKGRHRTASLPWYLRYCPGQLPLFYFRILLILFILSNSFRD